VGIFEFTCVYSRLKTVISIYMEFGRSNMAIILLYSILGSAMTRNFEYMVGRMSPQISNLAIKSLNSKSDIAPNIEISDEIAKFAN
jgi:hypothetical protein